MNCKHEFVGRSDGVKCRLCGLFLTAEQIPRRAGKTGKQPCYNSLKIEVWGKESAQESISEYQSRPSRTLPRGLAAA